MIQIRAGFAVHRYHWEDGPRVAGVDFADPRVCGIVANTADRVGGKYPVALMMDALRSSFQGNRHPAGDALLRRAAAAMDAAVAPLSGRCEPGDGDGWDLGGSATLVTASGADLVFAHVGEFRASRVRVSTLERVQDEHTLRAQLEREGMLEPGHESAAAVITACLGTGQPLPADFTTLVKISGPERFVIACPSLHERLADAHVAECAREKNPEVAARTLLDAALAAGDPLIKPGVCIVDATTDALAIA